MNHQYWDITAAKQGESFGVTLKHEAAHTWQQLRELNDGMTNADLVRHVLAVTAHSIQAHLRGVGPYISMPAIFTSQQNVFEILQWPRQTEKPPNEKWRKLEERVGTVLGRNDMHHLEQIRLYTPKKDAAYILGEAARLTRLADGIEAEAERDPTNPGYYVIDPQRQRPTSLYEVLGIGRWAPANRLHIVTTPGQKGAQP